MEKLISIFTNLLPSIVSTFSFWYRAWISTIWLFLMVLGVYLASAGDVFLGIMVILMVLYLSNDAMVETAAELEQEIKKDK